MNEKFPQDYISGGPIAKGLDWFQPQYTRDSRGRLVQSLPGYSRITYGNEPGSTYISQSSESSSSTPIVNPGTLQTGSLYAETRITIGGTIILDATIPAIAVGADPQVSGYSIVMKDDFLGGFQDSTLKFGFFLSDYGGGLDSGDFFVGDLVSDEYVHWDNSAGILYVKGSINATSGYIGGWTIASNQLYVEYVVGGISYRTGLSPTDYPFYAHVALNWAGGDPVWGTQNFSVDIDGNIYMAVGIIVGGKTGYSDNVNAGFFLGEDSGSYKLYFGSAGDAEYLKYDGTNLNVYGGTITAGTIQTAWVGHRIILSNTNQIIFAFTTTPYAYIESSVSGTLEGIELKTFDWGTMTTHTKVRIWEDSSQSQVYLYAIPPDGSSFTNAAWMDLTALPGGGTSVAHLVADQIFLGSAGSGNITMAAATFKPNWGYYPDIGGSGSESFGTGHFQELCLGTSCITSWPGGSVYLSNVIINTNRDWSNYGITNLGTLLPYWSGSNLGSVSATWGDVWLNNLQFATGGGYIYYAGYLMFDFWTNQIRADKPLKFKSYWGKPGNASAYSGAMYYDTSLSNLIYSNGSQWYSITSTPIGP